MEFSGKHADQRSHLSGLFPAHPETANHSINIDVL